MDGQAREGNGRAERERTSQILNVNGGAAFYYAQDHEGSVTNLINASGSVIESYKYDAFGAVAIYNGAGAQIASTAYNNRFLFTGREYAAVYQKTYVPAFKFYEYRARAYNPELGRFMSEDHKLADTGDYHLFRYCRNDPVGNVDPMGLDHGPFESTDQAYRFFDAKWNATSIRDNKEYRVDIYRVPSGRYHTTNPIIGQRDTAERPPILAKNAERKAIAHSHGDWSKGFRDEQGKQQIERARNARLGSQDCADHDRLHQHTRSRSLEASTRQQGAPTLPSVAGSKR